MRIRYEFWCLFAHPYLLRGKYKLPQNEVSSNNSKLQMKKVSLIFFFILVLTFDAFGILIRPSLTLNNYTNRHENRFRMKRRKKKTTTVNSNYTFPIRWFQMMLVHSELNTEQPKNILSQLKLFEFGYRLDLFEYNIEWYKSFAKHPLVIISILD